MKEGGNTGLSRIRLSLAAAGMFLWLPGCAPSLLLGGAYFPAWILCMTAGLLGTILLRGLLLALGIDRHVTPRLLAYPCLMLSLTLLTWLIFYTR